MDKNKLQKLLDLLSEYVTTYESYNPSYSMEEVQNDVLKTFEEGGGELKRKYTCPYCKKEQTQVIEDRLQRAYYTIDLEDDNCFSNCQLNEYGDIEKVSYYCPECDKKLPKALVNCLNL